MAPEAVAPYLTALKSVVTTPHATGQPVDPAMTERYLEACQTRKATRPPDEDEVPF